MHIGGIFCDLAKAFYCVNRENFLANLHYYGVQGTVASWFTSCPIKKKPEIKSSLKFSSKWGTVKHGVPQRSILRVFVFHNIYE